MDNTQPEPILPSQKKAQAKIIQPPNPIVQPEESPRPKPVDINSIYPEATKEVVQPTGPNLNPTQAFAMHSASQMAEESGKFVWQRVKSVLVAGILFSLASLYALIISFGLDSSSSVFFVYFFASLIQLLSSIYMLISKDPPKVALILKIYLVLQLIGLIGSIANPTSLVISLVLVGFLFYVYGRVKSLGQY